MRKQTNVEYGEHIPKDRLEREGRWEVKKFPEWWYFTATIECKATLTKLPSK
jgi:hypothetical protein